MATDKPIYIPNVSKEQLPKVRELHELHTNLKKENKQLKQEIQRLLIIKSDKTRLLLKKKAYWQNKLDMLERWENNGISKDNSK